MGDTTKEIIAKLQDYKQQGLSYYQATQQLLESGYTQLQIDDAEDEFHYDDVTAEQDSVPNVQNHKSIDESYEKVGQTLIKDTKKRRKPNIFLKSYTSHSGFFYGAISGRVWASIIIGFILSFYFGAVYHTNVNNARYCNDLPILYVHSSGKKSTYCAMARAEVYGWPIRGETVKYYVQDAGMFTNSNRGVETLNFLFFIALTYLSLRTAGYLLNRWHS